MVYGRRRVGKTRLLVESLRDQPAIYFMATESPATELLRRFMGLLAEYFDDDLLGRVPVNTWDDAFELLEAKRQKARMILVLDEFQWAATASKDLSSVLQRFWDHQWKDSGFHLVLCGSYLGFMEREVLAANKPLFGRRTMQMLLQPFGAHEAVRLFDGAPLANILPLYFVFGGVPAYLEHVRLEHSLRENIINIILDRGAPLNEEPVFLLREELRDFRVHVAVLAAIASGSTLAKEIAPRAGIAETKLGYYLSPLMELGYVERIVSIEKRTVAASKKSRYRISDPLLRFYFRFAYPYQSQLSLHGPSLVFDRYVQRELDAYLRTPGPRSAAYLSGASARCPDRSDRHILELPRSDRRRSPPGRRCYSCCRVSLAKSQGYASHAR